ncbi:MAG: hypothetical protein E7390_00265 [Ruminococcaceae bacterium]|nr:hypothetical protein [Oscillospiraceae bacterium]
MAKLKRAVHIDFHTMPGIYNFGKGFDATVFAERLQSAHVEMINMFFQCNIGHVYYPTKIGVPYPDMKGDMFGDIVRECRKRGIRVVGYTNTAINHVQALLHPEWQRVDAKGRVLGDDPANNNFCRPMCFNNEEYRRYLSSLIREVVERYDIDGIFADCMNPSPYCHCSKCTRDMKEAGLDITNEAHVRYFAYEKFREFALMIRNSVPEGKLVQQTGVPFDWDGMHAVSTHGELECLPTGGWGYDFFGPQVAYMRQFRKEILYMTGRFQASWGDFGGYKTEAAIENDCYDALCQGVQVSVGDHMHPAGNLDEALYESIGRAFAKVKAYEPWTDLAVPRAEIAVLNDKTCITKEEMRGGLGRNTSVTGAARLLAELKYGFDIINEDMSFDEYKVIILPDRIYMSDKLADKLTGYTERGGKLLCSGTAGLNRTQTGFAIPALDFLRFTGLDDSNSSYYTVDKSAPLAMYRHGITMESSYKTADYIKPYFNRHWDGLHGYFYTPPEKATGEAAVAEKDGICYICFCIFESYFDQAYAAHKELVSGILKRLLPVPRLKTEDVPSTARVTVTEAEDFDLLHVKTTYPEKRGRQACIIEEHTKMPAGAVAMVRGTYAGVYRLPEKTPVSFETDGVYTRVTLPEICGYDMFLLEK